MATWFRLPPPITMVAAASNSACVGAAPKVTFARLRIRASCAADNAGVEVGVGVGAGVDVGVGVGAGIGAPAIV
ncbi:MAG TPA: hypothetical protein DDZ81_12945 [Acetobacteraceae bacterium]|nr:hypothetical protein [Acetobacteraceae bacterium]